MKKLRLLAQLSYILISTLMITAGSGCSYVSDAIEGAITDRAAFSVDAYYNSSAQTVAITWEKTGGKNFSGYEVYITEVQDDEYAGYILAASRWWDSSGTYDSLDINGTGTFTHDVSSIVSGAFPYGPGRYFYRVGVIKWDHDLQGRTQENGYIPEYDPLFPNDTSWDNEYNYNRHTGLEKISGFIAVDIY